MLCSWHEHVDRGSSSTILPSSIFPKLDSLPINQVRIVPTVVPPPSARDLSSKTTSSVAPSSECSDSRTSQKIGPCKPDGAVGTIGQEPSWFFGSREDKLHIYPDDGLSWAHHEAVYQSMFYAYLLRQLCGSRLGMLVVNTAFQRLAWLDDEVLAIEATTSTRSSASFTDDQMSIDDLDSHTVFWQSIPNTLLFETNPHTHPNADSHSSNVNYHYIVSAQKRFIRFYQSVYYLAANATIPSCQQRSILPLPRALQKVPQAMAASDLEAVLIYGPGSPTPILPSVSTPLYPPGASTRSPSETGIDLSRRAFTAPLTDVVSDRTFFAKVVADVSSVAIAGRRSMTMRC